jgi:hypothetical protein
MYVQASIRIGRLMKWYHLFAKRFRRNSIFRDRKSYREEFRTTNREEPVLAVFAVRIWLFYLDEDLLDWTCPTHSFESPHENRRLLL